MIQLGQHPAPSHVIAHISDTHFLGGERALYGQVDTDSNLQQALAQLTASGVDVEAIVFTGDLADLGEADAYARLRAMVEPVAEKLGAQIIWVMGNHDERAPYAQGLFDEPATTDPQDRVYDVNGLRVISFDTTVPGYHHGDLTDEQLAWLADELATPAPDGTILAVHHPPVPTPLLEAMGMLELQDQTRLERVIRGTDVRAVLGGHLHYSTHSTFAGVPVSVAAATCYTLDLTAADTLLAGVDFGQSINLVHTYPDRIVHSVVPVGAPPQVFSQPAEAWAQIAAMTPEQRHEMFSAKNSPFNQRESAHSSDES
ncbi:MAG: phosphodiesterase [Cryobacterium sp.]|nr:phosphodiesterase [Cryobacterium sp.]